MKKFWIFVTCLMSLAFLLAGCYGSGYAPPATPAPTTQAAAPPASGVVNVELVNFAFSPQTVTVAEGTRVIWTNKDSVQHTVTEDKGAWDSGPINPGQFVERVMYNKGVFQYHCTIHPRMTSTVIVE